MLYGRRIIYTPYEEVNNENIVQILTEALAIHLSNADDIEFLYNYYKGIQPILFREKAIRPEINNKIVENHANSIVQFKAGYLLEKPIQFVARKEEVDNNSIAFLNDCMMLESKETRDKELANWQAICGTSYRLCLQNKRFEENINSPFKIYKTDPRQTFVVYTTAVGNEALLGVVIYMRKNDKGEQELVCQAYSKDTYYEWVRGEEEVRNAKPHILGGIPLVEYPFNQDRIGSFEIVIHLLDGINKLQSNRLDGVEQFIQALLIFKNVDISKEDLKSLLELGAIKIKDDGTVQANVEYLTKELNQEQVQKLKDDMLEVVYKICGMPLGKGGSTGNSQGAVIMRDGWSEVEARTQETELMFKDSERQFLKIALNITRILTSGKYKINLGDLDIKFTRRNYENIYQKTLVLDVMLKNNKIAPRLAFEVCGLFGDSEGAYNESEEYYRKQLELAQQQAQKYEQGVNGSENQPNNPQQ